MGWFGIGRRKQRVRAPLGGAPGMSRPPGLMPPSRRSFAWAWKTLAAILALAALAAGAYGVREYMMTSPRYMVREVVVNAQTLDADQLREYLKVESGTPIFGVDLEELRRKLLDLKTISQARVSRRMPGTIVVEVVEREPVARLGRTNLMVDNSGTVFVQPGGSRILPIFTGYQRLGRGTQLAAGDHVSGMMLAAIELLGFAGEGEGRLPITDIDLSNEDYLLCTLSDQRQARIAWEDMTSRTEESRERLRNRIDNLISAMNSPRGRGYIIFDASIEPDKVHGIR